MEQYNGVDVKHVRNGKYLAAYLTKYVTKSREKLEVLPYHSSRDVSALFYCFYISAGDVRTAAIQKFVSLVLTFIYESDYAIVEDGFRAGGTFLHLDTMIKADMLATHQILDDCHTNACF